MTKRQISLLRGLLRKAQAAALDPDANDPALASKLIDKALAKLEKADK